MVWHRVGIIPAAGKSTRFGGLMKELLPLPDGRSLLSHAVERLSFCDRVVIVTSAEKEHEHRRFFDNKVKIMRQCGEGMWSAIRTAYNLYNGVQYYMTMPDTWIAPDCFAGVPEKPFGYGYFFTDTPERFGCWYNGQFIDKCPDLLTPATAWGVLTWGRATCVLWDSLRVDDYTTAINKALEYVDWGHWSIGQYFDCANMDSYMNLLDHLRGVK